ncbi:membrane-bound lytic murein transglycosylase MltF [Sediminicurvatus halobius]|uniref:Membrane-bound lytic murein transglycosylase F n=1 Tax=Sediminicurvatus halobius TaxID=2182432 RepID=A0A2U2N8G2_9GAMM|nr:membrane-bound lytic murein transglycosylase MltF [Spiribacter halobius]PWG65368.1 membrane-bound lytic murein transglycosylase MltF [Spiribacter halobius]UEX76383.1 membrane-bound lytic murein transglycosylase MltF [Spiribacter halobius]
MPHPPYLRHLLPLLLLALLGACGSESDPKPQSGESGDDAGQSSAAAARDLAAIRESGELVVITRNAPTTWYIDRDDQPAGPEHDLIKSLAAELGLAVRWKMVPTVAEALAGIANGEADIAAAGLTITEAREERFRFGPPYQQVTQQVVCRRDNVQPETVAELVGLEIEVIAGSSYSERLSELQANGHPDLAWRETAEVDTEALLRRVWEREIDCTVADSTIVDINRRYYPELIAPFNLSRAQSLGWVMPPDADSLAAAVADWHAGAEEAGLLTRISDRYYGFYQAFDYVDIARYVRRIDERFPRYREWFREAAEAHDLPFSLIAAQGYQESHWNPEAQSPTGVRGIMMLTLPTARELGVENRLDPRQSIFGGARYLARMKDSFVEAVPEPDRTFLALAAYNIGRGHMHDAQSLARELDLSPHLWSDMKTVLPLLADERYYRDLRYGYARGSEPVRYVQRIREYRAVLEQDLAAPATAAQ